jgi:tyrosine type site-specific recombinase|nr:MAG TPA: Integrase [Caudoviricetes sp.]
MKIKEIVRLREKPLKDGQKSLYLDIYVNGVRSYEFLKLYLQPETSKVAKDKNKQTLLLADAIKAKRIVEIQTGEFKALKDNRVTLLSLINSRVEKKGVYTDKYLLHVLKSYLKNKDIELSKITLKWVEDFFDYLKKSPEGLFKKVRMKSSSARVLCERLSTALNDAVRKGFIQNNPCKYAERIKFEEAKRAFLTQEELKRLAATPCKGSSSTAEAFLFSCLTGLRYSDVKKLTWSEVSQDLKRITFVQKKTSGLEYLDLSPQASQMLKERNRVGDFVFYDLPKFLSSVSSTLKRWAKDAGIDKNISFHTARHTFATMLLTLDVDLYTVSKLLGHKDIKTTQIYAKIIDKKKQDAVNKIPQLF